MQPARRVPERRQNSDTQGLRADVRWLLQSGASWNTAVKPKALGAWNLHAAVEGVPSLEHFVCFSSIVGTVGNVGAPGLTAWRQPHTRLAFLLCMHLPVSAAKA